MNYVNFQDKATINVTRTKDSRGFLHGTATFARVGIQEYTAQELGLHDKPPGSIVKVLRRDEEVFDEESMASFANSPITDGHPTEEVTSANWKRLAAGFTGPEIKRDGDHTTGKVVVTDADMINKVERGKVELSCGYRSVLDTTGGVHPKYGAFDVEQTKIRGNHIAIVEAGRCGGACRIHDSVEACDECKAGTAASCNCHGDGAMNGQQGPTGPSLVSRVFDSVSYQMTEQGAQVFDRVVTARDNALTAQRTAETTLADERKTWETEKARLEGEVTGLKAQLSDDALDQRAQVRADLIEGARAHLGSDYDPKGKSNAQIMKDAVIKVHGASMVEGKDDNFVQGVYAALGTGSDTSRRTNDSVRDYVRDGRSDQNFNDSRRQGDELRGRDAYLARLQQGRQSDQRDQRGR